MIILFLTTIFISIACLIWGNIFLDFAVNILEQKNDLNSFPFAIICLAGLSVLGLTTLFLSIFIPIDWKAQLMLLFPALLYLYFPQKRINIARQVNACFTSISVPGYFFLLSCMLLVFVINSFEISHPDTLAYHAQAIKWMENYPATPGIVHLRKELGLQSLWFALEALFNFGRPKGAMVFYAGPAILCWFLIFMVEKIGGPLIRKQHFTVQISSANIFPILVLAYAFISWTQIRLTAASASPDFIDSIFILAAFYLFTDRSGSFHLKPVRLAIALLFCVTAINIKLSAIVIILLPVLIIIFFIQNKQIKPAIYFMGFLTLALIPLLIRNYIATGFILFPSGIFNFFDPDWKYSEAALVRFQHYITAYARFPVLSTNAEEKYLLSAGEWFPYWWRNLTIADRSLVLAVLFALVLDLFFLKALLKKVNANWLLSVGVLLAGVFLWFMKAPDPRFGTGWLIALLYCLLMPWESAMNKLNNKLWKGILVLVLFLFFGGNLIYASHRFSKFWMPGELFFPIGLDQSISHQITCGTLRIYYANGDSSDCGSSPLPCATDSCTNFRPRGKSVRAGFSARE